ncbi:cyclic-di-AMP-binding protein CbpB [Ligilactobacillus ceti]|uniref:CBS domain protein n=1 Tax=Ligilactobacillus ceti DSM 22408 TaxID=1122146 RepID=A0A0R2KKR3_9LACO|nr:cyclic-di-AMP-binding protein CbpB [Ligilactobacillus ceti]KRN89976.1 CBS domain protein [Ligilactobacillus ceti DSM 22408]
MISQAVEKMLTYRKNELLIPASIVANVQEDNYLDHAFLVLTKVRYAKIPVIDKDQKFKGLISLAMITDTMLGLNGIDPSKLSRLRVADVMQTDVPTVSLPYNLDYLLHVLVDHSFLVVVNDKQIFQGIITRRELLKNVNYLAHEMDKVYSIETRNEINEN